MLITKNIFCSYTRHVPYKAFTYIYSFRWIKESMLKMVIRAKIKNSHIKRINILSFPNWTLKHVCIFQPSGRSQVFCQVVPSVLGLSSEQVHLVNLQDLTGNEQGRTILSTLTDTPFVVGIYQEFVTVREHKESRIP